jgi:hypothetical protein
MRKQGSRKPVAIFPFTPGFTVVGEKEGWNVDLYYIRGSRNETLT